jgi:cysteinyl-tRNA synthetase
MAMKYLGEHFDIHCGGIDHISIHHTNEIAQAEALTGKPLANYWLHGAFLVFGKSAKMAKSTGEIITVQTLIDKGFDPLAFRYLCLTAHYRSELVFTWESLQSAQNALSTLRENVRILAENLEECADKSPKYHEYYKRFLEFVNDDLNMPKAIALTWSLIREEKKLTNREKYDLLLEFDRIFALDLARNVGREEQLPPEVEELVRKREEARKAKDWATADKIREQLRSMGILIEDTPQGVKWRIIKR